MKNTITIVPAVILIASLAVAFGSPESEAWLRERRQIVENARVSPTPQNIDSLAEMISIMSYHERKYDSEARSVLNDGKATLMSIPGWADYLGGRLHAARDRVEAEPDPNMKHSLIYRELKPASGGLSTLARLPSPDSVRVLGEFLHDERGRFIQDPNNRVTGEKLAGMLETRTSNSEYAVSNLIAMSIIGAPPRPDRSKFNDPTYELFDEVPAWREWYERIKSGRATFRFEGDPVEYDLNGPASPGKLARIKANRERDTDRERRRNVSASDGEAPATVTSDTPLESAPAMSRHLPLLLGVVFLLASMVWYFLRREKRNPM